MGRISLGITDAPVDGATAVVVKFTAVELKPEDGSAFTINLTPAQSVDLLVLAAAVHAPCSKTTACRRDATNRYGC